MIAELVNLDAECRRLQDELMQGGYHADWDSPESVADLYAQLHAEMPPDPPGFWDDPIVRDAFAACNLNPADATPLDRPRLQEAAMRALAIECQRLQYCEYMEPVRPQDVGTSRDFRLHLRTEAAKEGSEQHKDDKSLTTNANSAVLKEPTDTDGSTGGDSEDGVKIGAADAGQLVGEAGGQECKDNEAVQKDIVTAVQALHLGRM